MAKISYANLKLKIDTSVSTFDFNGETIEVLNYLPIEKKYDLVMITLQKSFENNIYNPLKIDMYFHLYLVYMYTNLSLTEKQKEDELKLYDVLSSNGFIDKMLETISEKEYNDLYNYIIEIIDNKNNYNTSAAGIIKDFLESLPANMQQVSNIIDNFDPKQYQAVLDFAAAANGGRTIK